MPEYISATAELQRLHRAIPLLLDARPIREVLADIIRLAAEAAGTDKGSVLLLDPATGILRPLARVGLQPAYDETFAEVPLGFGPCGRAAELRDATFVEDVNQEPEFGEEREALQSLGIRAVFTVPILAADGRCLGTLANHFADVRRPSPEDVERNRVYAQMIAVLLERRWTEEAQIRQIKQQESLRVREESLAIFSHDIRNPLSAILAGVRLLERSVADGQRDKAERQLAAVERATGRINRLVQDYLDVTSLEAGRVSLQLGQHAPAELVAEVVDGVRAIAAEKGIDVEVQLDEDAATLACDRERMLQVLGNLLGNAVKFTPEGGTVTVSARAEAGRVHFCVADTGIGMRKDELAHVFDRFWRAKNAPGKGFGLGLAIAKGIVEAHEGRIWAESEEGRGTRFYVAVPQGERQGWKVERGATSFGPSARVFAGNPPIP